VYTSRGYKYKVNGSGQRIRGTHEIGKQREREREYCFLFLIEIEKEGCDDTKEDYEYDKSR